MALNSVVKVVGVVGYYPFWVATFLFMNPLYLQEHVLIFSTTVSPLSLHCGSSRQQDQSYLVNYGRIEKHTFTTLTHIAKALYPPSNRLRNDLVRELTLQEIRLSLLNT